MNDNRNINNNYFDNDTQLFLDKSEIFVDDENNIKIDDDENRLNIDIQNNVNSKIIEVEFNTSKGKSNIDRKNNLVNLITNRKFLLVIIILSFVFVCVTVGKVYYLRDVVDNYEEFFLVIEEKESSDTIVYNDEVNLDEDLKTGAAADELTNCLKKPLSMDELPSSISSIINEINHYYNQSNNYFSFKYKDIYTGFNVSYNEGQGIFTASTIKGPKDIYLYKMASLGKINLDDKLVYTSGYYNTGSGVLKNESFGTSYTIEKLLMYSTVHSDNAAHNMLMDKYGRENMLNFWKEKGTNAIFTQYGNWGITNAHDAVIYMEYLYDFYNENSEYGQKLMNNFLNAKPKFIQSKNNYKIANKSGWSGSVIHDVSIVFADNPYIVVGLSNLGDTDYYMSYFNKVSDFASRLHTEYWKYKMDVCGNINQY